MVGHGPTLPFATLLVALPELLPVVEVEAHHNVAIGYFQRIGSAVTRVSPSRLA